MWFVVGNHRIGSCDLFVGGRPSKPPRSFTTPALTPKRLEEGDGMDLGFTVFFQVGCYWLGSIAFNRNTLAFILDLYFGIGFVFYEVHRVGAVVSLLMISSMWDFRKEVVAWLGSVVYHSFVHCSSQHIGRCWYVLEAFGPEFTGPTRIPLGLAHVFQGQGVGKWILLKHGNKTWSVFVCDNEFTRGWEEFYDAHDLQINYKVVIGCERRWVFEVFVLDNANISVVYPWSRADHGWQSVLPLPEKIVSSCLPSTLERQQLDLRFMLLVAPGTDFLMELENCLSQLFTSVEIQETKVVVFENDNAERIYGERIHRCWLDVNP
ncbi:hypothetical protein Vadar_015224 [Vaccinium darrowii]|uniref:Uncharacterized protein n=1 Tax=Vaccinium darrowii TaxID=229202 RepID=A0ACB7YWM8_9ERIC|nr:hypothetical protein Vadar_015224 [Vaccinium darrowii]